MYVRKVTRNMAGKLSDAWLDDLRAHINIVDIVSEHVTLKPKGRRYWGLCPFHNEKTASFSVNEDSQMYYCFGCHKGGNVFHFVMEMERMEFTEAVSYLADRAHIPMPDRSADVGTGESKEVKELIFEANKAAAYHFHNVIWTEEGAQALTYLSKRGFDDADIRRYGLGASGMVWDGLTKTLINQGFSEEVLIKAGLTNRKDGRLYDMFRNRVMFPIINAQGRVLGFGGRAMGDAQPKYLNTSDTPVFNKRQELYAMNFIRKERALAHMFVVEGYMDVLSLRKHGVAGVVATLGTALTEEQARLVKRYVPEVWVCYDGDAAGQKATLRALDIFGAQGIKIKVLNFPGGMDPDDFIRAHGLNGFENLKPMDAMEYRMLRAEDALDMSTQEGRTQYAIECCNMLKTVKNPVERENYLARLALKTGFQRSVLLEQMGVAELGAVPSVRARAVVQKQEEISDYVRAERTLVMLIGGRLISPDAVSADDFETPLYRDMAHMLLSGMSAAAVLERLPAESVHEAAQALNQEILPEEKKELTIAEDCLRKIRKHRIEQSIDKLKSELAQAETGNKSELTRKIGELMQELQRLKTGRKEWTV